MTDTNGHTASPAKGRGRGRGRGGGRGGASKAAVKKPTGTGRRGRQKLYGSGLAQAAAERQKEIKSNYTALMTACISAAEDLAQRTIDQLKNEPHAHEEPAAHGEIIAFLNRRLGDTVKEYDSQQSFATQDLVQSKERNGLLAQQHFHVRDNSPPFPPSPFFDTYFYNRRSTLTMYQAIYEEATEDFLDASLLRLDKLEHLFDNKLPVDVSVFPPTPVCIADINPDD